MLDKNSALSDKVSKFKLNLQCNFKPFKENKSQLLSHKKKFVK